MGKLTATGVKNAKPGKHADGAGLYLWVKPSLAMSWVLRVQYQGRRSEIGLGSIAGVGSDEQATQAAIAEPIARPPKTHRTRFPWRISTSA